MSHTAPIRTVCVLTMILAASPMGVCADIEFAGTIEALASRGGGEDRQEAMIATPGTPTASASATFQDASASVQISALTGASISSLTVTHQLDSGPVPVGGSASSGEIAFALTQETMFSLDGLLEQQSTNPSGGGLVRIRSTDTFVVWFQAGPNFALPNNPIDFSAILSEGVLDAGNYELTWFHAANRTSSNDQTLGFADFTLTLSIPGCNSADLNADGELNFFDVSLFLKAYGMHDPVADFNGDGLFNFFDVSLFLTAYQDGCP